MPVGGTNRRASNAAGSKSRVTRARRSSISKHAPSYHEADIKLPYRDIAHSAMRKAKAHNLLSTSPENIIGAFALTGTLKDKDLTDEIIKEFNENDVKLCRSSVVDQTTHQSVEFLTTDVSNMIEKEIAHSKQGESVRLGKKEPIVSTN